MDCRKGNSKADFACIPNMMMLPSLVLDVIQFPAFSDPAPIASAASIVAVVFIKFTSKADI